MDTNFERQQKGYSFNRYIYIEPGLEYELWAILYVGWHLRIFLLIDKLCFYNLIQMDYYSSLISVFLFSIMLVMHLYMNYQWILAGARLLLLL